MSKRNRNKFRVRNSEDRVDNIQPTTSNAGVNNSSSSGHAAEYRIISADLVRLVVLNGLMLALVLVVYFTNQKSQYLEKIFTKLFNM